jgi:C_GCAxxG_C_C family probable redox protein
MIIFRHRENKTKRIILFQRYITNAGKSYICLEIVNLIIKNMEIKKDKALAGFRSGLNCAQAVLTAYSDDLGFNNELALGISCGFGGGMGRLQETCGAVTGSFMVLGIYNSGKYSDNQVKKEETYSMIQKFNDKFKSIHGAADCKSLLKCDLRTEDGQEYLKENRLVETVCEKCISDSIRIIEELVKK